MISRTSRWCWIIFAFAPATAWATGESASLNVFAILAGILILAKILSGLAQWAGIPSVLAELVLGIALGTVPVLKGFQEYPLIQGLSEWGVLLLMFLVGLETNLGSMRKVGREAFSVATVGVVAPMALALVSLPLLLDGSLEKQLFFAATLTATSVGITVRVLRDAGKLASDSGQVILGAAVIDDVMGLFILTVVAGIIARGSVNPMDLLGLLGKITLFITVIALARRYLFARAFRRIQPLEVSGTVTVFAVSLCLLFAWVAQSIGLAGILGAFALGVALDEIHFSGYREAGTYGLEKLMKPMTDFLVPVFFITMGMGVDLSAFGEPSALLLAGLLIACAILGKLACALAVRRPSVDRWLVGVGMIPRGEVGIIFAVMGLKLGVFTNADYSAVIMMVVVTTLLSPWLLGYLAKSSEKNS